jgi:hypothetical protein
MTASEADQRARMTFRACCMSLVVASFLGCAAPDRSITRGADRDRTGGVISLPLYSLVCLRILYLR